MRKCYTILFTFFFIASSFAQNTALTSGDWDNNKIWSEKQVPQNGQVVEIPNNVTVEVNNVEQLTNSNLDVKVFGKLVLNNGKLRIGDNSKITLYTTGSLISIKGNSADQIAIGGVEKFNGKEGTLTGPLVATKSTNGFVPVIFTVLPVQFASFSAAAQNGNVLVQWATAREEGATYFEVERSTNGTSWSTLATVKAAGNSNSLTQYAYTDKAAANGTAYYRIKQAGADGKETYTAVQTVRLQGAAGVNIIAYQSKVAVQFTQAVKGKVSVLIVNPAGQVVARQTIENAAGQVLLNTTAALKGTYFVTIQSTTGISASKQVVL